MIKIGLAFITMLSATVQIGSMAKQVPHSDAKHVWHQTKSTLSVSYAVIKQVRQRIIDVLDEQEQGLKISMMIGIMVGITVSTLAHMIMHHIN
jgi:hypothetical protein